jgi:hypothetical protein
MALWVPKNGGFFYKATNINFATIVSGWGTTVTPGASDVEGAWTEVLSDLATEASGIILRLAGAASTGLDKSQVLDLGWDPAGGTAYEAKINNIICGASPGTGVGSGTSFLFPIRIPVGAAIAVRIQGSNATPGTVEVAATVYGRPKNSWTVPVAQYSDHVGTITGSQGVTFVPGTDAFGAWVSLGTTTKRLWWWQIGAQISNATTTAKTTLVELGAGSTGAQRTICRRAISTTTSEVQTHQYPEDLFGPIPYNEVREGSEIWIRGFGDSAPESGWNGAAIALGG